MAAAFDAVDEGTPEARAVLLEQLDPGDDRVVVVAVERQHPGLRLGSE
jgi:hypothetical protein